MKHTFGLIGFPLEHSWSPSYFQNRFRELGLKTTDYQLFSIKSLDNFSQFLATTPNLRGLNVTIPYKQSILTYLDTIDPAAREIGAVNTITIERSGDDRELTGYNTDADGFALSADFSKHTNALVLGTGGASKAVTWALQKMGISFTLVSRSRYKNRAISYSDVNEAVMESHTLIINTTPVGMFPNTDDFPSLPYRCLTSQHLLYDLVYNPEITAFMKQGMTYGASVQSGLSMLHHQAELALKLFLDEG
ncbi:MAG: shikimate dehydrogenase [Bacteroidales bacterium]|nr:shikimate dehydrogenase [Bacteroidales bacterium]